MSPASVAGLSDMSRAITNLPLDVLTAYSDDGVIALALAS